MLGESEIERSPGFNPFECRYTTLTVDFKLEPLLGKGLQHGIDNPERPVKRFTCDRDSKPPSVLNAARCLRASHHVGGVVWRRL